VGSLGGGEEEGRNVHLGMKSLKPLSVPTGGVQASRSENSPSSVTRKLDTWGRPAEGHTLLVSTHRGNAQGSVSQ